MNADGHDGSDVREEMLRCLDALYGYAMALLTYALVSNLPGRGVRSCMVCHQDASDRDFIEKPARSNGVPAPTAGDLQPLR